MWKLELQKVPNHNYVESQHLFEKENEVFKKNTVVFVHRIIFMLRHKQPVFDVDDVCQYDK